MTLHFSHMGLTLARTFMILFLDLLELELFVAVGDATAVMSYGVISTWTLSPGRMRMRCMRIFPELCARTVYPFSNSTRTWRSVMARRRSLNGERVFLWLAQVLSPCNGTAGREGTKTPSRMDLEACQEVG